MGENLTNTLSKIRDYKRDLLASRFKVPYNQAVDSVMAHNGYIARLSDEERKEWAQLQGEDWEAGDANYQKQKSRELGLAGRPIEKDGDRYIVRINGFPYDLALVLRTIKFNADKSTSGPNTTTQDSIPQTSPNQPTPPPVVPPVKPPVVPPVKPPVVPPVKPPYQRPGMPELRLPEPIDTPVRGTMPYGAALYNSTGYFGPAGYTNVSNPKANGVFSLDDFKKSQATSEECGGKLKKHLSGGKLKRIIL